MAKTLLAVDDSVTMRKVLEITFSGEDYRVIGAESTQAALGKLGDSPQVAVIDTVLAGEDGYALAKEVRKRNPATAILLLASRYAPYDQARGKDAGADDWADKPFDTQQLIDKVRKMVVAKEAEGSSVAAAPPPAPTPAPAPVAAPAATPNPPAAAPRVPAPPSLGRGTQPSLANQVPASSAARTGTLVFGESAPVIPPARPAAAAPPPPPPPPPVASSASAPPPPPVAAAVNGHLAGKLGDLGLTKEQADAVLALSREVVERVVWEVVPQLAEAIIKEEIARLTRE